MSPEQAEGREVGPPSDIFSLGAVLAFAATGQGPFGTGSTPALVYRVVYSPPNLDHLPAEVRPLIERCLAKDPAQRPTAAQVLAEAGAVRPGAAVTRLDLASTRTSLALPATPPTMTAAALGPVHGQPGPSRRPRRHMWRPLAIASISVGLLAGCTFTGVALTSGSGQTTAPPTSSPTPSASGRTSMPATVTPTTSAPTTSAPVTVTPTTSAPVTPSASPTVTATPSATATPAVTVSASPSPTASVTPTAITTTVAPTGTPATPVSAAPVTTTATP